MHAHHAVCRCGRVEGIFQHADDTAGLAEARCHWGVVPLGAGRPHATVHKEHDRRQRAGHGGVCSIRMLRLPIVCVAAVGPQRPGRAADELWRGVDVHGVARRGAIAHVGPQLDAHICRHRR